MTNGGNPHPPEDRSADDRAQPAAEVRPHTPDETTMNRDPETSLPGAADVSTDPVPQADGNPAPAPTAKTDPPEESPGVPNPDPEPVPVGEPGTEPAPGTEPEPGAAPSSGSESEAMAANAMVDEGGPGTSPTPPPSEHAVPEMTDAEKAEAVRREARLAAARLSVQKIKIGTQREGVEPPAPVKPSHKPLAQQKKPGPQRPQPEEEEDPLDTDAKQRIEVIPGDEKKDFAKPTSKVPIPNRRGKDEEEDAELAAALGGQPLEALVGKESSTPAPQHFAQGTRLQSKVLSIHDDNVFIDLGTRHQGVTSMKNFGTPPEVGQPIEVIVQRFDPAEGLYLVGLPGSASDAGDWSTVSEGMMIEAVVTGTNKGGLECKVGNLRGFMPAGQVSIYRVENLDQLVGEKLKAVITECKPQRKNLVLSARAAMEREREEAKDKLMLELEVGQTREGIVRSLRDFGAFVDLGGVDALLHVREMAWTHVKHPKDILQVGQRVKVKVTKIDPDSKRIALSLRDLVGDPWSEVALKFPVGETVTGKVSRITQFGAFVQLGDGVEGLIHISELDNGRVWRVSDVVSEGEEVTVKVMGIESDRRRIALSRRAILKATAPAPKKADDDLPPEDDADEAQRPRSNKPLKGGLDKPQGGEGLGLKL
jgi:small subunit ribosomal protein S1